jgi:hypothetical protein
MRVCDVGQSHLASALGLDLAIQATLAFFAGFGNPVVYPLRVGDNGERPSTLLRSAQDVRAGLFDCISLRFIPLRKPAFA